MIMLVRSLTILVIAMASLNMMDFSIELRFENARYNYLFVVVLSVILPISIFVSAFTFKKRSYLYSALIVGALLAFPSYLTYTVAKSDYAAVAKAGKDLSFEQINEVRVDGASYRLYRTNGGATTSFGLVLRKEIPFIKGLKIVKIIFSKNKASESTLSVVNESTLQMNIEPYSKGEEIEVVTLNI